MSERPPPVERDVTLIAAAMLGVFGQVTVVDDATNGDRRASPMSDSPAARSRRPRAHRPEDAH